ncbi:3-hydroxyacyl-CoA dehydrogenase/enoyl-CoA hydratase family protein [Paramaledivibacter caminithermalis]|jgi:3-hydroxyacyl-CoA dehydrogenase|uniref:3-hydroxyacyl-CoA dehydrogenase n=1 Tax=Paramaledivibacter caminithermalis (strain DSM 15212 / CIP 107654 / DViRD3) TaxID=1121301 RepID=A0A1M6MXG0_PARC5|nr:3-hydroxyacyl-CoA dehydrogenase/enoyl-CoA hydratase family protein [Paramaledivibacter caminithermalis]SHJ88138.1 3-hydroxyacyl-CoA dehydrogenase [Paramaledivibacter caminithermalis DSM 15212]
MDFNINKVAVLGAGVMGAGIAAHIVGAGIPVCLLDIVPRELTEKEKAKGLTLDSPVVRNRFAQAGKDRVTNPKNRAIYDEAFGDMIEVGNFSDNMDVLKDCDWIIEVIVENLEVKKNFMKQINKYRRLGSIVSSNTSGVSINKIVGDMPLEFRQHFLGTHFFNPPRYMKLFELIPGEHTLPEIVDFMTEFGTKKLGKGVVLAKDTPNFVGNRIGTYAIANTIQLMEKYRYDIPKVDQLTGNVMGRPKSATFRTLDMVGLDIFHHVAENVINNIDDEAEKSEFNVPKFVVDLIENGQLGDKTKQGFYKKIKTERGKEILVWDRQKKEYVALVKEKLEAINEALKSSNKYETLVYGKREENKFAWEAIKNVLLYSARKIPEITDNYKEIDNAMMWGFNWELGPFAIWDAIGLKKSVSRMKKEGEVIPEWIEERLAANKVKFYDEVDFETPYITISSPKNNIVKDNGHAALVDIGDDVLCLQFKTKGNTITDEVMDMIYDAVEEVQKNYKGLVIGNQSKNFSAGANLMLVGKLASDKKWNELEDMVNKFQRANMAIKYCKKPVVVAPYGMTLGGGAEITMHSHFVSAHAETYMGLVEVGVGLVPAGGGTKELLVRSIENLGKVNNGEMLSHIKKAWKNIATAKVSSSGYDAIKNGYMRKCDNVVMSKEYLIDEAKAKVLYLAESGFRPLQKNTIKVLGTSGKASLQYVIDFMLKGGFISEYDAYIADKVAHILTGGEVPAGIDVTEEQILELEKEAFVSLCGEEKTLQRIGHMLNKGRPLRN